jgi:ADP-heptose:LPS heptosyltransferase
MIWRKPAPQNASDPSAAKTVLVIQLGGVVAFVQALAAARRIRQAHVGARINLLTTETTRELAEKCPYFDTVEADGRPKEAQAITKLIARVRAAKYDMIYDLEGSNRTNNYFQGMRPWPPNWSGSIAGCSHPYLDPERASLHPLDRFAAQLKAAGIEPDDELLPDLRWLRQVLRDPPRLQPDFFGIRAPYVLLFPRGSDSEPARRWPEAKYIELARRLAHNGVTPLVMGGAEERQIGAAIVKAEPRAKNLVTRADLLQCIGLAERAAFAVGDDVDLMHVTAAAGAACLVFVASGPGAERAMPRSRGGAIAFTATVIADLPVEQVARQLRNCGVYSEAATA